MPINESLLDSAIGPIFFHLINAGLYLVPVFWTRWIPAFAGMTGESDRRQEMIAKSYRFG